MNRGFTLIEMSLTLAILGLFILLLIPNPKQEIATSTSEVNKANVNMVGVTVEQYRLENQKPPIGNSVDPLSIPPEVVAAIKSTLTKEGSPSPDSHYTSIQTHFYKLDTKALATYVSDTDVFKNFIYVDETSPFIAGYLFSLTPIKTADGNTIASIPPSNDPTPSASLNYFEASSLALGQAHALAIKKDGSLWAFGTGTKGQLGQGTSPTTTTTPLRIGDDKWEHVSSYGWTNFGIKQDGTLWTWGMDMNGVLGHASIPDQFFPLQIGTRNDWKYVQASPYNALAVTKTGELYAWGVNSSAQLGLGSSSGNVNTPTRVGQDSDWTIASIGTYHSLGIKNDGTLWSWGTQWEGTLGNGLATGTINTPTQVGVANNWRMVYTSTDHSYAIKTDGTLWSWGNNSDFAGGRSTSPATTLVPTQVGTENNWDALAVTNDHVLALKTDNTLWSWGNNNNGELGIGNFTNTFTPTKIPGTWKAVSGADNHCVATKTDGTLWTWGQNTLNRLGGTPPAGNRNTPYNPSLDTDW